MKFFIYLLLAISFTSCNKRDVEKKEAISNAQKYFSEYLVKHDQELLNKSYNELKNSSDNEVLEITQDNKEIVLSVLLYSRRYDELINVLNKDKISDPYKKDLLINLTKALQVRKNDKELSKTYINNNLIKINERLNKNPKDSLIYIDYFTMKLHLTGKNMVIKEIDSMANKNKMFSVDFYEFYLKDAVNDYPRELQ